MTKEAGFRSGFHMLGGIMIHVSLYAAGVFRPVIPALIKEFLEKNADAQMKEQVFGGSGELAKRIEKGEGANIFLSADPKNAKEVGDYWKVDNAIDFARNDLVLAVPKNSGLDSKTALAILADPAVRIGVYPELEDACGDYTHRFIENIKKDHRELGSSIQWRCKPFFHDGKSEAAVPANVWIPGYVLENGFADVFITYGSFLRGKAAHEDYKAVELPKEFAPEVKHTLVTLNDEGKRLGGYLLTFDAEKILREYGFLDLK